MALGNSRRDVTVRMRGDVGQYVASQRLASAATREHARDLDKLDVSAGRATKDIDVLSGRLGIYRDAIITLGPAAVPITATVLPALTGLAAGLGFAAVAGVTAIGAFQGVGDAVKALEKAELDPTVENLEAARVALQDLSPAARGFVGDIRGLVPQLKQLRDVGAEGLFPGLSRGLDGLERALPLVERVVDAIATESGEIGADIGQSLASDRYSDFLIFLAKEGPEALRQFATATGNVIHAGTEFYEAFDPTNDKFGDFLVEQSQRLSDFAEGLPDNENFGRVLDYIDENGPQVAETLGAIGSAVSGIVQAAAPLGGPTLQILETVFDGLATIAKSDLGTPIFGGLAALALYNRGLQLTQAIIKRTGADTSGFFATQTAGYRSQVSAVRELPTAIQGVRAANGLLAAEQTKQRAATTSYVGQLQVANTLASRGYASTAAQQNRLADSLGKVELANFGVRDATDKVRAAEARRSVVSREAAAGLGKTAAGVGALTLATTGLADGFGLANTTTLALAGSFAGPWGAAIGGGAGLLLDLKNKADASRASLERVDAALASGDRSQLAASIKETRDELARAQAEVDRGRERSAGSRIYTGGDVKDRRVEEQKKALADLRAAQISANRVAGNVAGYERQAEAIRTSRLAAQDAAASFLAFGDTLGDQDASLDDFIQQQLDQAKALQEVGPNIRKAFERGLNKNVIADLVDKDSLGAGGAERLAQLADGTDVAIDRMNASFRRGQRGTKDFQSALDQINAPKPEVTLMGAEEARDKAQAVNRSLAQVGGQRPRPRLAAQDGASRVIGTVLGLLRQADGFVAVSTIRTVRIEERRSVASGTNAFNAGVGGGTNDALGSVHLPSGRGLVRRFAMGDVADHHQPELAGPGYTRVWREPETKGEAYIPLANDYRRPRAQRVAADAVRLLGGQAYFAEGGFSFTSSSQASGALARLGGAAFNIVMPDPVVSRTALVSAQGIAVAARLTARSAREEQQAALAILEQRQRIAEIERSLAEVEEKRVKGKNGKDDNPRKKGKQDKFKIVKEQALQGLDREVAVAQLEEERRALVDLINRQGELNELSEQFTNDRQAALDSATEGLTGQLDIFARGSARSGVAAANRFIADYSAYGQTMAALSGKASPVLLQQIKARADAGDVRSALRIGKALLAQPELLGQLNVSLGIASGVISNVAGITSDPRFLNGGFGNLPQTVLRAEVSVNTLDPAAIAQEAARIAAHQLQTIVAQIG